MSTENLPVRTPVRGSGAGPTFAPALMAAGMLCLAWGVVTWWPVSLAGLAVAVFAAARWVRVAAAGKGND